MGFESRAISARVTKQIVTILVKHVIKLYTKTASIIFLTCAKHDKKVRVSYRSFLIESRWNYMH